MKILELLPKYIERKLIFYLSLTFILIIFSSVCTSVVPLIFKKMIDKLNTKADPVIIINFIIIYFFALILEKFFNEMQFLSYPNWENGILRNAYSHTFEALFKAKPDYFTNRLQGTITSQISQAISGLDALMFDTVLKAIPLLINFIFIIITIILTLTFTTALIIGIGSIVYVAMMYVLNGKLVNLQVDLRNSTINVQGITTDLVYSWKDIKLNNAHEYTKNIIKSNVSEILNKSKKFYYSRSFYGFIQSAIVCFVIISANGYEILRYLHGLTTIGGLVLINNYLLLIMRPLESFSLILRSLSKNYSDFISIDELLKFDKDFSPVSDNQIKINSIHLLNIKVDNVINNLSLDIQKGDKIAIIGNSGAGKSTIFNILTGLRTDYKGEIFINGNKNNLIEPSILRNFVAYCNSDARLFKDTLFNNISLDKNSNINEHVEIVSLHDKIKHLKKGTESIISQESSFLSSGEMQRVKIARTLALNRDFELYDESSSAFDDQLTEKILNKLLERKNKTVIFITHSKKFLNLFDKIYILRNGNLLKLSMENLNG